VVDVFFSFVVHLFLSFSVVVWLGFSSSSTHQSALSPISVALPLLSSMGGALVVSPHTPNFFPVASFVQPAPSSSPGGGSSCAFHSSGFFRFVVLWSLFSLCLCYFGRGCFVFVCVFFGLV